MLAAKVIAKELAESIKITPGDLETYYEANKRDYVRPERARISQILVRSKKEAQNIRKELETGKEFAFLAKEMSLDSVTGKNGGELSEWVERNEEGQIPGIGNSADAVKAIFSTDEGKVVSEDIESEAGIHVLKVLDREPERQKNFDEVKNEVFIALRSRKEREVQQQLFASLKEQYDVVVHYSAFADEKE
jgi:foldase protein PrsA